MNLADICRFAAFVTIPESAEESKSNAHKPVLATRPKVYFHYDIGNC